MPRFQPSAPRSAAIAAMLFLASSSLTAIAQDRAGEPLQATIAGEFAAQAGKLEQATRWYLQAAREAPGDVALAKRATRIALVAGDDPAMTAALQLWRARAPGSLDLQVAELILALRTGDETAARTGLAELLRAPDPGGWRGALEALGGARNPELGAKLLGEAVEQGLIPGELQAWLAFGGLAQHMEQPALAARIVETVIARFPDEPLVALLHASQLRESDKLGEARAILAGLEPGAATDPGLRLRIAREYSALEDPAAAARVLGLGPQDEQTWRQRAALLAAADDREALGELYDTLKRDSSRPDPDQRLLLGQVAEFLERNEDALQWYRGVAGGDERWLAALRAANVLHALGRQDEARAALHDLQAEAAADEELRRDAYLLEAELCLDAGDVAGEMDAYARGLAAFADDTALLYSRGIAWERRDDIARAEADFRRILVAEPDNVATLNALGYTLADRTERYTEALELIDRARVAEPDNAAIIDSYGWVLYRLGRNQEALVQLRRAFALQKDPEIASHLAQLLWVEGEREEARRIFEEARKLDPDNRALQRALRETGA